MATSGKEQIKARFCPVEAVEQYAQAGNIDQAEALLQKIITRRSRPHLPLGRYSMESIAFMNNAIEDARGIAALEKRDAQRDFAHEISEGIRLTLVGTLAENATRHYVRTTEPQLEEIAREEIIREQIGEAITGALGEYFGTQMRGGDSGSYSRGTEVRGSLEAPDMDFIYVNLPRGGKYRNWKEVNINRDPKITEITPDGEKVGLHTVDQIRNGVEDSSFDGDEDMANFVEKMLQEMDSQGWSPRFGFLRTAANGIIAINFVIQHPLVGELPIDINIYHEDYAFGLVHREKFNDYVDKIKDEEGPAAAGRILLTVQRLKKLFKEVAAGDQNKKVPGFLVEGMVTAQENPLSQQAILDLILRHDPATRESNPYMREQVDQMVESGTGVSAEEAISSILRSPALSDGAYEVMKKVAKAAQNS